ncbi:uncharacterized protein PHALS_02436 [Plasmopara halstedii]|uniref:Photolyase/cryptochrome alpha/beta domain-containing protein n=1 Tax=Plasmopara halstedii TaxID=4781 RepID=A0A0P1A800_PLAHL|nr:uncharacterized protein PHALS_02436 [Plasmopara halstedii]CEG36346.1 hypothetical protein PHALS_02436 [Plasmopara halstedii]|eukprot:XP_024572715.1 hypothetical protein PHALS_02436 [Plasmopara halstedii]
MSLPNATEVRRISTQLAKLEQQRAQGNLPHEETPLRLYSVRTGGFVRVLDKHPEPISQGMLEAIDAFISESHNSADIEEIKTTLENKEQENDDVRLNDRGEADGAEGSMSEHGQIVESCDSTKEFTKMKLCSAKTDDNVTNTESATCVSVKMLPPWENGDSFATPIELIGRNELVSEYLGKQFKVKNLMTVEQVDGTELNNHKTEEVKTESWKPVDHRTLFEHWPPQLEERRKLWFVSRNYDRKEGVVGSKHRPVLYWMHNTLRVMQGNYGLEAAILLSRRLQAPLVVFSLIPSSIIYPICHSTTASDAYARFSLVELYQQFLHAGVPFYGLTFRHSEEFGALNSKQTLSLNLNPLYEVLDAFKPIVVVADAMFDAPSRNDFVRLTQFLDLHRSSCLWSLVSMDSLTCCPIYQLSANLKCSFKSNAAYASEEQFVAEYATYSRAQQEAYAFSVLPRDCVPDRASNQGPTEVLASVMQRLHLEEVNWHLVKAGNFQSSCSTRRFSEGEGLQKLSQLLSSSDNQPAIQAELRGGGVLSLLPFIRHGTLFAGYVLRRISEAIVSRPTPKSSQERRALAMLKVMRSRAAIHLGKERDYALYLALWSAVRIEVDTFNGVNQLNLASLSTSEIIASLDVSESRASSLQNYQKLLPSWAFSAANLVGLSNGQQPGAALYDLQKLESAQTQDRYWNEIQKFVVEQQYLHPLLVVYWAYRLMTWNVSVRAAIATIDSLLSQCTLGSNISPDAVFMVWKLLFRLGSSNTINGTKSFNLADPQQFQRVLESEIASQPKLQLYS